VIGSWVLFPALLVALSLGCGLLVARLARVSVPGALLVPLGLATIVVAGQLTTATDATAELTVPLVAALAVAGFALSLRSPIGRPDAWITAAALAVYAVYGAPVLLSGEATFAGYIRLDDTATWLALTDRVMEHGQTVSGLAPSTYEATLAFNLGDGYPVGVFLPLGIGHVLTGIDSAWLIQPYMSLLAACIALCLWAIMAPLVPDRRLRALVAAIGAQPALLVGYAQWGGVKEVAAAALIALAVALAPRMWTVKPPGGWIALLAVAVAALLAVLSLGGMAWVLPALVVAAAVVWRRSGLRAALGRATALALLVAALSLPLVLPALLDGRLLPPTSAPLTGGTAQGNLIEPLGLERLFGVWPAGDFRLDAVDGTVTAILILIVAAAALLGLWYAAVARTAVPALYAGGVVIACLALFAAGSPWVGGKALATASPAVLALAAAGAATAASRGRLIEGSLLLAAIVGGVLWSNALAHRDANLAPREQLAELERIGDELAGQGPALMTEYQPYGARHFLREADAEAASELRRRRVPLRDGETLTKGNWADTDEFDLDGLADYRTLVLRRSPVQSRPPAPYLLTYRGEYYDVWQRPIGAAPEVVEHVGLGDELDPAGRAPCGAVRRLARLAGDEGTIAFAEASPRIPVFTSALDRPESWEPAAGERVRPSPEGTASLLVRVPESGTWRVWLGGSIRGRLDLRVDGAPAGSVRHFLNNAGLFVELGSTALEAGEHLLELDYSGADLRHPGSGGRPEAIGPLILTLDAPEGDEVRLIGPGQATELCGQRLDWMAALR
jgi:hypothetical protein